MCVCVCVSFAIQAALIEATESLQQARVAEQGLRAENTRVIELSQVYSHTLTYTHTQTHLYQTTIVSFRYTEWFTSCHGSPARQIEASLKTLSKRHEDLCMTCVCVVITNHRFARSCFRSAQPDKAYSRQ